MAYKLKCINFYYNYNFSSIYRLLFLYLYKFDIKQNIDYLNEKFDLISKHICKLYLIVSNTLNIILYI